MVLKDLLKQTEIISLSGDDKLDISGIAFDSRAVKPGNLFVCINGLRTDGHAYIEQARNAGAIAILTERPVEAVGLTVVQTADTKAALAQVSAAFYGNPASRMTLIGVTGTNGKTTVTTLIKSILEFNGKKVGLIGTNQNMIGDKIIPTERTTPDALELNRLFAVMEREGVECVVMEVSSHALELKRVYGLHFAVGVFTNITQDHLDFHKTMDAYMAAKRRLFDMCSCCAVNADDVHGKALLQELQIPSLSFSIDQLSDVRAEHIKMSNLGVIFDLMYNGEAINARVNIPGRFSVYNALAAVSACLSLNMELPAVINGLLMAKGVKGRAEVLYTRTNFTILIDYAHTPDGLENIISTVKEFTAGRVITLFGCGGDRDSAKRPIMGRIAGTLSDYCVITSDNPRTEEPMAIIRQIKAGIAETGCDYTVIENRREAIRYAIGMAQKDDCIILAGKGHETYQILGTQKVPFDEREIVKDILASNSF